LVVPTYQEVENIDPFLRAVRRADPDLNVLIVDDASPDGTGSLAEEVGSELGGVEVLHRPGKLGLGAAYRHGFAHALSAGHDVIAQMDADFSHDPAVLPELLAGLAESDVMIGSRYVPGGDVPGWTWIRRSLSSWGNSYARAMLRLSMRDATTAFRAYRADALRAIDIEGTTANGYLFQIETAYRISTSGLRVQEIPITFADRLAGSSKMAVVRTMAETELRVTWWGLALRAPGLTDRLRATGPGRFLQSRVRPSGVPAIGTSGKREADE
jgi:dolichol-phosphate mannosyltransferase